MSEVEAKDGKSHEGERHKHEHHGEHPHREIEVLIYTTSGSYPRHGFIAVPVTDQVSLILADAKDAGQKRLDNVKATAEKFGIKLN